jgi:hypothetical protein
MNYHYIDYMIKERQRDELEACERKRLLKTASQQQPSFTRMICNGVVEACKRLRNNHSTRSRLHDRSIAKAGARARGGVR